MESVEHYLSIISVAPLLTPDEEKSIGRLSIKGDYDAITKLVRSNLRLVVSVAKEKVSASSYKFMEYITAGNVGLFRAAQKFDPSKGFRFSTYAMWWIEQAMTRDMQKMDRTIHIPSNKIADLGRARKALEANPDSLEAIEEVARLEALLPRTSSLEAMAGSTDRYDQRGSFAIPDESQRNAGEECDLLDTAAFISRCMERLTGRDREILELRLGLDGEGTKSLEEVGSKFNVTRERIRQLQTRAIDRLRVIMYEEDPDIFPEHLISSIQETQVAIAAQEAQAEKTRLVQA